MSEMSSVQAQIVDYPKSCEIELNELSLAPTFAMSLGAKELFHTNFLAFLLESRDEAVKIVQQKLKELLFGHQGVGPVLTWREKNNLDLVIVPRSCVEALNCHSQKTDCQLPYTSLKTSLNDCSTVAVVIEAKLKSLPTLQQLKEYDGKLVKGIDLELEEFDCGENSSTGKLKLILIKDNSDTGCAALWLPYKRKAGCMGKIRRVLLRPDGGAATGATNWDEIGWAALAAVINPANESGQDRAQSLLSQIVSDYQHSLSHLVSVINKTEAFVRTSLKQNPSITYGAYYEAITDESFRRQRLHDLVGKYASHVLELHVFAHLKNTLSSSGAVRNVDTNRAASEVAVRLLGFDLSPLSFILRSATFFTRQQPGIEFEWCASNLKKNKTVRVGVQVQGKNYRHYMCVEGGNDVERENALRNIRKFIGDWFEVSIFNDQKLSGTEKNKDERESEDISLYAYGIEQFRYTQTKISELPLCELATIVGESLGTVKEALKRNQEGLQEKFSEFLEVDTGSAPERRASPRDTAVNAPNT